MLAVNTTITHLSIDEIIYQTPNTLANVLQSPSSKGWISYAIFLLPLALTCCTTFCRILTLFTTACLSCCSVCRNANLIHGINFLKYSTPELFRCCIVHKKFKFHWIACKLVCREFSNASLRHTSATKQKITQYSIINFNLKHLQLLNKHWD